MFKCLTLCAVFALSMTAFADDKNASDMLQQSKDLFSQRQAFGKEDPALLTQIEEKLNAAAKEAVDADLRYEIWDVRNQNHCTFILIKCGGNHW